MEPLLKQLRELPARFAALPAGVRWGAVGVVALVAAFALVYALSTTGDAYEYAFTNLSTEDSAEASTLLKQSAVPFRLEAGGTALAVPRKQVYDARLLLAAAGLPRGGGNVGFELFDRGDLGVSEFTQKVNLRRSIEGELARTISRLSQVRSARVHITLSEQGLYRDEDRKATAAVVLNLRAGMTPTENELKGIRHLVSSSVPGLTSEGVTIVDGRGAVLSGEEKPGETTAARQHQIERDLEQRLVSMLEPIVGAGAAIARVSAELDDSAVDVNDERVDPESTAVRSERKLAQQTTSDNTPARGEVGAAANDAANAANNNQPPGMVANRGQSTTEDETRNFEVTKTVTRTVTRGPRVKRLSVAILLDGVGGQPRTDEDLLKLRRIAEKAVGIDENRGDQLEISSAVFARIDDGTGDPAPVPVWKQPTWIALAALAALIVLLMVVFAVRGRRARNPADVLRPGSKIGELEAALSGGELPAASTAAAKLSPLDPDAAARERARELALADPVRAAHLLRSWMASDVDVIDEGASLANRSSANG